jgi:phosphate:Na+ symporter
MVVLLTGGLGVFLLGMVLMTDGLKALAGDALRRILMRVVAGPISGMVSGAVATALVQSSTATTITTIGFVSAGLMTFPQAVGVIFGANIGTTSTGWIVSQLGFKVSLGSIVPPFIFVGVAMRLMGRGRVAHAGVALAGFGLLFVGIDMLQRGMSDLAARMSPADLPSAGLGGRLVLVGFGVLMTVVMKSSSAAMATTLAAVATGAINVEQAAALAIGQNIGTAVTSALAAIGATTAAKRTALAHVLFNVFTGAVAFAVLPLFVHLVADLVDAMDGHGGAIDAPTALAAFHTAFNVLGVVLLFPVLRPFSRMIERIVPERAVGPERFLDPAVATVGPVAMEAARRALLEIVQEAAAAGASALRRGRFDERRLHEAEIAVDRVRSFVHGLAQAQQSPAEVGRMAATLHAIDHAARLIGAVRRAPAGGVSLGTPVVDECAQRLGEALDHAAAGREPDPDRAREVSTSIADLRRAERKVLLEDAAARKIDPDLAVRWVDALLWMDRVAYHLWRAANYLAPRPAAKDADAEARSAEPEPRHDAA